MSKRRARICVIGAGPCGLTTTKTLLQAGHEVDCLERSSVFGGHWAFGNPSGRSSIYRSMTTNTLRPMNRFSDFDVPTDWPDFPTHEQVLAWFHSYVDHFGFREHIHLSHEVLEAQPLEDGGWRLKVASEQGAQVQEAHYDALVAASGYLWQPRLPEGTDRFAGTVLHAQDYIDPAGPVDLGGKSVVVVGLGNTGCELSCEIARSDAAAVHLSARSGTWILPKYVNGVAVAANAPMTHPDAPVTAPFNWLPARWRKRLFVALASRMLRRSAGERMARFAELGLPPAPRQPLNNRPTVNDELLELLEHGRIMAHPGIQAFEGEHVHFTDGSHTRADVLLCATGYHMDYSYLPQSLVPPGTNDLTLFNGAMHPQRHDLFFAGVCRPMGAIWPVAEVQARFIGELLAGRYALPSATAIRRAAEPIMTRPFVSPALIGAAAREELARGAKRAARGAPEGAPQHRRHPI